MRLQANFDDVLTPEDHVSRSPNDTYYVNSETVLRCHTSAHQASQIEALLINSVLSGPTLKDEADALERSFCQLHDCSSGSAIRSSSLRACINPCLVCWSPAHEGRGTLEREHTGNSLQPRVKRYRLCLRQSC